MNKIKNDILEEIILCRIKLFTKEKYYSYFRNIILELTNNIFAFRKKETLSDKLTSKLREKNFSSLWQFIFRFLFHLDKEIYEENEYDLEPLCFQYLKTLCYIKIKKLTSISNNELVPLDQIISIYLNLCEKQIKLNKEKEKYSLKYKLKQLKGKKSIISPQSNLLKTNKYNLSHRKLGTKKGPNIKPLDYTNSYTRLFIGETDEAAIRERYLSNMVVKKHKQLHLLNNYGELTIMYLKRMYKKLFKNEEKVVVDNDMIQIMKKFENDHKRIDSFQKRSSINNERPHYMYDYTQNILASELNKQKEKYNKKIFFKRTRNKYKNRSFIASSEISKDNNLETGFSISNYKRKKYKNFYNPINYGKSKLSNSLTFSTRGINSYKYYKILHLKQSNKNLIEKKIKKNYSAITSTTRLKNNKSLLLDSKKKFHLKNYLSKNDFFFS